MRYASAACLVLAVALNATPASAQLRVGTVAPDIELRTLADASFRLSALKGRPIVMTFWGSWCPPCRQEFPELAELYRQHHAAGLEIVGVNQRDQEVSTAAVQSFVAEFAVPFTVVLDIRGRWRRAYRLVGLPTTVFIDTAGVISHVVSGPITGEGFTVGLKSIGIGR